ACRGGGVSRDRPPTGGGDSGTPGRGRRSVARRPSAQVLEFTLRRLEAETVGALMTVRVERDQPSPSELFRAIGEERLQRIDLEPLRVGSLFELIRTRLGLSLGRRTLLRLHETSGCNSFYDLELARALA